MKNDKILNLQLFYKGKNLDTAREERDIKNKFVIGSDKSLQWQILAQNFPKKHLLIKKTNDKFKLLIHKGMVLSVKSGEQTLDDNALKSKQLLKGNELTLDQGLTGRIEFASDWAIAFEYIKPWRKVITEEERKLIQAYQKFPEMTAQGKLTRNLFIIAFLLLLIGGFMFERLYTPPVFEQTLAQRVAIDVPITAPDLDFEVDLTPETVASEEAVVDEGPRDISSFLGFDPGAVSGVVADIPTAGIQLVTYGEQIVSAAGATGGGPGTGDGPSAPGVGRGASAFDASATGQRIAPGALLSGGIDASRLGVRSVDASVLAGQTGIQVTHISTSAQLAAIAQARQRAASAGLKTVTEEAIESAAPEVRATMANIRQFVDVYWRQVEELFNQERQIRDMYGAIVITLYFTADGSVEAAEIDPRPGSFFTESFLQKARELMTGWRIPSTEQMQPYQFTRRFIRN